MTVGFELTRFKLWGRKSKVRGFGNSFKFGTRNKRDLKFRSQSHRSNPTNPTQHLNGAAYIISQGCQDGIHSPVVAPTTTITKWVDAIKKDKICIAEGRDISRPVLGAPIEFKRKVKSFESITILTPPTMLLLQQSTTVLCRSFFEALPFFTPPSPSLDRGSKCGILRQICLQLWQIKALWNTQDHPLQMRKEASGRQVILVVHEASVWAALASVANLEAAQEFIKIKLF